MKDKNLIICHLQKIIIITHHWRILLKSNYKKIKMIIYFKDNGII